MAEDVRPNYEKYDFESVGSVVDSWIRETDTAEE